MDRPPTTRRGFLGALATFAGTIPILGGLFVAGRAAATPSASRRPERLPLCKLGDVPDDGLLARKVSYEMRRGPAVESVSEVVFVTREADGTVVAMSSRCTHLGCTLVHRPDDPDGPLVCPCHDGAFSKTGEAVREPVKTPLTRLNIEVPESADDTIWLIPS